MGKPDGWVGSDLRARAEVVQWLHLHGPEIEDPQGLIVGRMRADLKKGRALSQLIADMERDGMIEREVRGRRTMRLKLLDDWGLLDEIREHQSWQISGGTTAREGDDQAQDLATVDLEALAATLLERVIKQAHAKPSSGAEVERLKAELAELKARATDLGHQLIEARSEAEDQRRAAETMRENLTKLENAKGKGGVKLRDHLSAKDRALLDRLMRTVPSGR